MTIAEVLLSAMPKFISSTLNLSTAQKAAVSKNSTTVVKILLKNSNIAEKTSLKNRSPPYSTTITENVLQYTTHYNLDISLLIF